MIDIDQFVWHAYLKESNKNQCNAQADQRIDLFFKRFRVMLLSHQPQQPKVGRYRSDRSQIKIRFQVISRCKARAFCKYKEICFSLVKWSSFWKFSGQILAPLYKQDISDRLMYILYNDESPEGKQSSKVSFNMNNVDF